MKEKVAGIKLEGAIFVSSMSDYLARLFAFICFSLEACCFLQIDIFNKKILRRFIFKDRDGEDIELDPFPLRKLV